MDKTYHNLNNFCPKCSKPYTYIGDVPEGGFPKGQEPYCTCGNLEFRSDDFTFHYRKAWKYCPHCGKELR